MEIQEAGSNSKKYCVLLVEDDVFVSDVYSTRFKREDCNFVGVENGRDAMKWLENNTPDIILLDIMMPYMNGMEVLEALKKDDRWKHIPVIMLTNLSERENVDGALALGANDYVIKSHFTPSEVVDKVNVLLRDKA
jgi:DNA-binding response OmpR family regulator